MRSYFIGLMLLGLFSVLGTAMGAPQWHTNQQENCLLLGPNPSLIIKYRSLSANFQKNNVLNKSALQDLSQTGIHFTRSRIMAGGAYIVFFDLTTRGVSSPLKEVNPGCYRIDSVNQLIAALKKHPDILDVEPNSVITLEDSLLDEPSEHTSYATIAPIDSKQWPLLAPPGGIHVQQAWEEYTTGSREITAAIVDTGITNNEALASNVLPGVHFTESGNYGLGATVSCANCLAYDHGTHVAGIIAATGTLHYDEHVFGIAPSTTILPINVFSKTTVAALCGKFGTPCLTSSYADLVNALSWLSGTKFPDLPLSPNSVAVVNMSLGMKAHCDYNLQLAILKLFHKNITIVAGAGNDNSDAANFAPANCANVIAVAATGPSGERAFYSNWGEQITLAAPGGSSKNGGLAAKIYSTIENGYGYMQGTSMATPHVTAVVALLYAIDPNLDGNKVKHILTNPTSLNAFPSPDDLPPETESCMDPQKPKQTCGAGIINAYKAVNYAKLLSLSH